MQQLTWVKYVTSEQHKDLSEARQERDIDTNKLDFKSGRKDSIWRKSAFAEYFDREDVNLELAEEVEDMIGNNFCQYVLRKQIRK